MFLSQTGRKSVLNRTPPTPRHHGVTLAVQNHRVIKHKKHCDMHKLEKYVGRIVRLKQQACERIKGSRRIFVDHEENCFLVAAIDRQMSRLICYGANRRIDVCAADIVLI